MTSNTRTPFERADDAVQAVIDDLEEYTGGDVTEIDVTDGRTRIELEIDHV